MITLYRVCIPIGLACNFRCKYCYRGLSVGDVPKTVSPLMKEYLQQLDENICMCVCMSGGEPFLYVDTIKEIFSLVKPSIHKKIMTNGSLLTQDLIDYINNNDIEISLSHDGSITKELRGRDVLEEDDILELVKQIKVLTIASVVTNKNCDVIANYNDTVKKLGRRNFYYIVSPVYYNGYNQDQIDGFDYETFTRSYREYHHYIYAPVSYYTYKPSHRPVNFNVSLDGEIVDKNTLEVYGTVLNTREECLERLAKSYENKYCSITDCAVRDVCSGCKEQASEHFCRCSNIIGGYA